MALNRYYSLKDASRKDFLARKINCVFISHQQKDKEHARAVAQYLTDAGIDIYFDEYDGDLRFHHQNGDPKKVTDALCNGINNSSHMLVIVSPNTLTSSWVPFEIGYGFDKTDLAVLCLKGIPKGTLPEYIRTAHVIRDIYDLNNRIRSLIDPVYKSTIETKLLSTFNTSDLPMYKAMDTIINDTY